MQTLNAAELTYHEQWTIEIDGKRESVSEH